MTEKAVKKLHIVTHGCQMNEYDSARMQDLLGDSHAMVATDNAADADVILLNTCSIREKAQEKVFHQLGRWKHLKQANPNLVIGVGGCVASQEGEAIAKRAPFVDLVFGPQTLHRLPEMMETRKTDGTVVVDISFPEIEKFDRLPTPEADGASAFVSIMEGCSKYCTFCVVPYTRGEEVSRPMADVLTEIAELAAQGVREVNLLGQNVNAYRGDMPDGSICDFAELIPYVADIEGIDRIRYTTSHPVEFSDALIDVYSRVPELVSHLHLPVQSGSDRILMAMKRGHTTIEYKSKIRRLRALRPDISISSDFIIGFPGETDKDNQATIDLIKEIKYSQAYSFKYSIRPGTPAAISPNQVDEVVKNSRLQEIQCILRKQQLQFNKNSINSSLKILVLRNGKKTNQYLGRSQYNQSVYFNSEEKNLIGSTININVTEAFQNSLTGNITHI